MVTSSAVSSLSCLTGLGPFSGLSPNVGDEFLDDFKSVSDFDAVPENKEGFKGQLLTPTEDQAGFYLLGSVKRLFTRLGEKLGYMKKPHEKAAAPPGSSGFEFQCMTADDKPIMVEGMPVTVSEPGECHRYYLALMDPTGNAELDAELDGTRSARAPIAPGLQAQPPPPQAFLDAAKKKFQSNLGV